jgi:ATP phosphoribosyltransferase regulatory subunit
MKKYNLITPEGTRDLLFKECTARREIENKMMALFRENGFHEVITPFVEFCDVFDNPERSYSPENMYKLTDSKGRLMVIRPDSTLPIIRLAETRLKDEPRPLKLCYNQTIYRANPKESGRDDEIAQCGVELIGGNNGHETLILATKVLGLIDGESHFEIGDCGIFNRLVEIHGIGSEKAEELRRLIESKRITELSSMDIPPIFAKLPKIFGGTEVFDELGESDLTAELKGVYEELGDKNITVDLGLTNKRGYYTGILFNGYVSGYGKPVISGGEYKINGTPGAGFAVNVSAIARFCL